MPPMPSLPRSQGWVEPVMISHAAPPDRTLPPLRTYATPQYLTFGSPFSGGSSRHRTVGSPLPENPGELPGDPVDLPGDPNLPGVGVPPGGVGGTPVPEPGT